VAGPKNNPIEKIKGPDTFSLIASIERGHALEVGVGAVGEGHEAGREKQ
jgi:hypothetical protein